MVRLIVFLRARAPRQLAQRVACKPIARCCTTGAKRAPACAQPVGAVAGVVEATMPRLPGPGVGVRVPGSESELGWCRGSDSLADRVWVQRPRGWVVSGVWGRKMEGGG